MRNEFRKWLTMTLAAFALFGYSAAAFAASGAFEKSFAVDSDAIVDVSNLKGSVVVRGGDVDAVTIRARIAIDKRYAKSDPLKAGKLINEIKRSPPVEAVANRVTVAELQKHSHRRYASISYEILVPREATVSVHSVSGDVRVSGINGEVNATSDTGEVTVADSGHAGNKRPSS
jgi:hypothetical protein